MNRGLTRVGLALAAAWLAPALAQDDGGAILELDPLRVVGQAEQRAAATSTVDAQALGREQRLSLDAALQQVPGVFAQNRYNLAQGLRPAIRGFGARAAFGVRGIRVLVDGVPLTLPDGQTELDALDLGLVERVDVLRGPASALFGNAAGGVIALHTRAPGAQPSALAQAAVGELGARRWRAEASGPVGPVRLLGAATRSLLDGPRAHGNSDTRLANARLDAGPLTLAASVLDVRAQDPGALTAAQVAADRSQAAPRNLRFDAGERIRQQRLSATWQHTGVHLDWRALAFAGQRAFDNRLPFNGGGQVSFDRHFGGLGWLAETGWGPHRFNLGLDAQLQRDDRQRFDNNDGTRGQQTLSQRESAESLGVHAAATWVLTPHWQLPVALRADHLALSVDDRLLADGDDSGERDFDELSGSVGLTRRFDQGAAWLRVATAFESPTSNELANPAGGGFNPQLGAAEAVSVELGARGQFGPVGWSAAIYDTSLRDELVPFELAGQPGRRFFRNSGRTQRRGLELGARWAVNANWTLRGHATRTDFVFERFARDGQDLAGRRLPGLPSAHGLLELQWQRSRWSALARIRAVGELFADDANSQQVPGHARLALRAAYSWPAGSVALGVDNVLDTEYNDNVRINAFGGRSFEPAPGRHAWLRVQWGFAGAAS